MAIRDLIDIYAGAQGPQEYLLDCDITLWVGINNNYLGSCTHVPIGQSRAEAFSCML